MKWTARYLRLLGVEFDRADRDSLARLVRAHVLAVPFENVTALLRRRDHPAGRVPQLDRETLLETWESRSGGGVCFEICAMLAELLTSLGYRAHLVLGQISLPNGHQAILVELDESRYLLDLGNGAPILAPIPLDAGPVEIHRHGLSYRFRAEAGAMTLVQDRMVDGTWNAHCRYDLHAAEDADRDAGYQHHHTPNASWVTGTLTMVRATQREVRALRDNTLTTYTTDGKTVHTVTRPADFRRLAGETFGLPGLPIEDALRFRQQLAAMAHSPTPQ